MDLKSYRTPQHVRKIYYVHKGTKNCKRLSWIIPYAFKWKQHPTNGRYNFSVGMVVVTADRGMKNSVGLLYILTGHFNRNRRTPVQSCNLVDQPCCSSAVHNIHLHDFMHLFATWLTDRIITNSYKSGQRVHTASLFAGRCEAAWVVLWWAGLRGVWVPACEKVGIEYVGCQSDWFVAHRAEHPGGSW